MTHELRTPVVVLLIGLLLVVALLADHSALARGSGPAVDWWVIAGGGASATGEGDRVVLHDTLGQPIVGLSSAAGGQIALSAGYWTGAVTQCRVYLPLVLRH